MKKGLNKFVILLTLATVFVSCKKDDDTSPTTNNNTDNTQQETPGLFVKVNFQDRSADPFSAILKTDGIVITGMIKNLAVELKVNATKTGTYTTKLGTGHVINYAGVYTTEIEGGDGKVSITEIDTKNKTMSGTFNAIVYEQGNSIKTYLTEGKFVDVPYTEE